MNYKIKFNSDLAVITRNGERQSKIENLKGKLKGMPNVFDCDEFGYGDYPQSEFLSKCFKKSKYDLIQLPFIEIFEVVEALPKHFTYSAYNHILESRQVGSNYELKVAFNILARTDFEIKSSTLGTYDPIPPVAVKVWKQMLSIVKLDYLDSFLAYYDQVNGVLVLDSCIGARAMCRILPDRAN